MSGCVNVDLNGKCNSEINTWTTSSARGFTGGFSVDFVDEVGDSVYKWKGPKTGVDGKHIRGGDSDRFVFDEPWHEVA